MFLKSVMNINYALTVDEPTLVLPSNVIKLEYSSFNLTCTLYVNSPDGSPTLTWHDSEGNILASNNDTQVNYVVLQFTYVHRDMSGVYVCNAYYNTFNYSDTTTLYIQCKYIHSSFIIIIVIHYRWSNHHQHYIINGITSKPNTYAVL